MKCNESTELSPAPRPSSLHCVLKPFPVSRATAVLPPLFQRWRRMEAVVMAEMEMRLMVGVTSTWSTLRPRGSSGALSGSEFFMAFPSWSSHIHRCSSISS